MLIKEVFKYNIVGLTGDTSSAKTNTLYYFINEIMKIDSKISVVVFGLKCDVSGVKHIFSIEELEKVKNSIIILDEFNVLFDIENRKNRQNIERILQFIEHNNNKLLLCGLPEHFKKFISAKIRVFLFKGLTLASLINGSEMKNKIGGFQDVGGVKGTKILNLAKNELLIISDYTKIVKIPYMKEYDTKKDNKVFW